MSGQGKQILRGAFKTLIRWLFPLVSELFPEFPHLRSYDKSTIWIPVAYLGIVLLVVNFSRVKGFQFLELGDNWIVP